MNLALPQPPTKGDFDLLDTVLPQKRFKPRLFPLVCRDLSAGQEKVWRASGKGETWGNPLNLGGLGTAAGLETSLGLTRFEADALLKHCGVTEDLATAEEVAQQISTLRRLLAG